MQNAHAELQKSKFVYAVRSGDEPQEWWQSVDGAAVTGPLAGGSWTRSKPLGTLAMRVLKLNSTNPDLKSQATAWARVLTDDEKTRMLKALRSGTNAANLESGSQSELLALRPIFDHIHGDPRPDPTLRGEEIWTADSVDALQLLAVMRAIHHQAIYRCRYCGRWELRRTDIRWGRPRLYCTKCGTGASRVARSTAKSGRREVVRIVNRLAKHSRDKARRARRAAARLAQGDPSGASWLTEWEKQWAPRRGPGGRPRKPEGPTKKDLQDLEREQIDPSQALDGPSEVSDPW